MLDPGRNSRRDDLTLPPWVRSLKELGETGLRQAAEQILAAGVEADNPEVIHGISLISPDLLNANIKRWDGPAVAVAFEEGKIGCASALLQLGARWPSSADGTSPFLSVVCNTGGSLSRAVSYAIQTNEAIRDLSKVDTKFPRLGRLSHEAYQLVDRFDASYEIVRGDSRKETQEVTRVVNAALSSSRPLARLADLVDALEYVAGLLGRSRGSTHEQFTRITMRAFKSRDVQIAVAVTRCIDLLVYDSNKPRGQHSSQPELMLLFNHPAVAESQNIHLVSEALTAADVFAKREIISLPRGLVHSVFGRIGQYTFGFPRFKHDVRTTESFPKTLLEEFGFEKVSDPPAAKICGACFTFTPPRRNGRREDLVAYSNGPNGERREERLSRDTRIVFRHSTIGVHNKNFGTLWIRNSSLNFGRDTMPGAAYFTPVTATKDIGVLAPPDSSVFNSSSKYYPIGKHEIFIPQNTRDLERLVALLDQYQAFLHLYRAWKFDTNRHSAWNPTDGSCSSTGLERSPGFTHIIDRASDWYYGARTAKEQVSRMVPSLAFVPPAHLPFTFITGRDALSKVDGISTSPRTLALLQDLASGDFEVSKFAMTDLWRFMDHAGIYKEGELILRDPNPDREIGQVAIDG